jgi:dTDP-4-amino-4,6-dideoxygalactose transaminase
MIPFVDLKTQYENHKDEFEEAISNVCKTGGYILGEAVKEFEIDFAAYIGSREAVGVASGTDALRLSCEALEIGVGDEILVPANTFIATAIAVHQAGAIAVPIDIRENDYLLDLSDAAKKVGTNTKAIMPVHLYGRAVDMDFIREFAETHSLIVIEDACQAHGAEWSGRKVGAHGAIGCFSFYPSKNLGCFGDGGIVVTDDLEVAKKIRLLRNYGSTEKYIHEVPGGNSRLDSIQASILKVKLGLLDGWNDQRVEAAERYSRALKNLKFVRVPKIDSKRPKHNVFYLYVIECDQRDELVKHLQESDIQTGIHYPRPFYLQEAFSHLGFCEGSCPNSERAAGKIVSLPMFPEIKHEQIDSIVDCILSFYGKR